MIAEISHKSVNVDSEDQLTGNVFGAMRYLPYSVARNIIVDSALPVSVNTYLQRTLPSEISGIWGSNVYFWKHYIDSQTEPDIVIELEQAVILIEVKYNSGLSGQDQLIRESRLLHRNYPNQKKILLLLAREESAMAIFQEHKSDIPADIVFGYITWQRFFDVINQNKTGSLVCEDIAQLLNEKGFSGFRGFSMMNEETMKAFRLVRGAHKNVQEFLSRCIALAKEKKEFEMAPMTGNNTFLRWNSDKDPNAWSYSDFITVFQRCCDAKLKNGYRNGALYILEINFDSDYFEVPTANIARYDYDDIKDWPGTFISPGDHRCLYDPLYSGIVKYREYGSGEMYYGEEEEPIVSYWGLKRVMGYEVPLSDITADNIYEKVFGTFRELANKK